MALNRLTALTFAAGLVLAGCGNDGSKSGVGALILGTALQAVAGGGAVQATPVTRAEIDKYDFPLLRVQIPARGYDALLTIRDDKGDVVTWTTTDGITFTFRSGVLIETRGLGSDLMSSAAPGPAQLASAGQPYNRSYYVTGENDLNQRRAYACSTESLGPEVIDVVGRAQAALHVRETCERAEGRLTSDYWLEGGTVRSSRQWVSPGVGYAEFARVNG